MDGVILTPLKKIDHPKGDIYHAMKKSDHGYNGFGEVYFSTINKDDIKGWKKHLKMIEQNYNRYRVRQNLRSIIEFLRSN